MVRSRFFTSLVVLTSFVSGCAGSGEDAGSGGGLTSGADPSAISDPGTDADGDGLPGDQDLCPGTAANAKVDGNGCTAEQREASGSGQRGSGKGLASDPGASSDPTAGSEEGESNGAELADGEVTPNGFAVFTLNPDAASPVIFRTLASNVKQLESGFELTGTVLVDVPNDEHVTLLEASVKLEYDAATGQGLQRFSGTVRLPFPSIGFMSDVEFDDLVYASVGYAAGKELERTDAPLKAERKYLYFQFSSGFAAQIGKLEVSGPGGQSVTMTLDPSDPAFFLRASLGGLLGPVDEASVGFSLGGHLPFAPTTTWGIDEDVTSFDGHLWIGGTLNLNDFRLPLAIAGQTVIDVDPNDDGVTLFSDAHGGFQFGSNSELDLSLSAGLLSFEVPIAQSSVVGRIGGDAAWAYYSGVLEAGSDWMPEAVPVRHTERLKAAGHASSDLGDMYFMAEGDLALDAGKLGEWSGIDLNDLALAKAAFDVDRDGVRVTGTASTAFSPYLGLKGDVETIGYFNGEPSAWYVTLDGQLAVSGIDLSSAAHARLDQQGLQVSGIFETPLSLIDMSGRITRQGVDVRGHAEVTIPIVAGKEQLQWVTDAAVCGYETVTDAAVCGYDTVADGAKCGYDTVKDGTICGLQTVRDATLCGTETVKDAAECGVHAVTSAVECGVSAVSCGWSCVTSLFSSCNCSQANTCNVANTCTIAKSCTTPASCNVPKHCEVPATCERVKTCQTKVTIPDFDYGTFKGVVDLTIGTSGLTGQVEGKYCQNDAGCTTLAGGRVELSSNKPEACVEAAGLGEFCAPF